MCGKRYVNRMNITAIITCFVLIAVFVFGSVQFAFAYECDNKYIVEILNDYKSKLNNNSDDCYYVFRKRKTYSNTQDKDYLLLFDINVNNYDLCSLKYNDDNYEMVVFLYKLKSENTWHKTGNSSINYLFLGSHPSDKTYWTADVSSMPDCLSFIHSSFDLSLNFPIYLYDDSSIYSMSESELNNIMLNADSLELFNKDYIGTHPVEYDSSIEIPLMAQCQVNGDKFLFNCKQSEPHDDYKLQISASVSLTPVYSNLTSKRYADTQQIYTSSKNEIGKYDNFGTTFNVSFSSADLLNGLDISRSALGFKEFYNGYNILLPYKESVLSKIYFYARNVSGVKCSNWVKVTYDLITETSTYEEVESVAGSDVPSDTKKDSSESYPDNYIYNDNEPAQDSNSGGIIGYIKSGLGLVGNNSIIALIGNTFSFLPKELTTLLLFGGALLVAVGIIKVVTR